MEASATEIEKPADVAMAEDICTLLEQTILKYFRVSSYRTTTIE